MALLNEKALQALGQHVSSLSDDAFQIPTWVRVAVARKLPRRFTGQIRINVSFGGVSNFQIESGGVTTTVHVKH